MAARKPGGPIPEGVKDAITALALEGHTSISKIARDFGVSRESVDALAKAVRSVDLDRVAEIRRGLPNLLSLLAASHAAKALENVDSDPAMAVKSTFGAKLAVEAGRVAEPGAEAPGHTMLTFINQLNVSRPPEAVIVAEVVSVEPVVPEFEPYQENV